MTFHRRAGTLITLTNDNRTAQRRYASTEFNNGIVMSGKPLRDNEIFEVRIDKRLDSWSGSAEIGVTCCNPEVTSFPASATGLREGTWILSGCNILKNGNIIKEDYGLDLEKLTEGDTLGVMRTTAGILHFFINGVDQGVAAHSIPAGIYAVVDIYGKCMQVTITSCRQLDTNRGSVLANQLANEAIAEATALCSNERLAFHERCGSLVRLSGYNRTAERLRPNGEFNNGVVMTNRPLKLDELFEIRLDTMIDKWSGSIEVGVTTHNPSLLEFPATMTNMRSGTIMMSGCGILTNGKGTQREYGTFNLDELSEGDRIGLIRKSNGNLHFYINSIDQGVAAENAPEIVWGVVDLYGMTVKVTILDDGDINENSPAVMSQHRELSFHEVSRALPTVSRTTAIDSDSDYSDQDSLNGEESSHPLVRRGAVRTRADRPNRPEKLTFHPICGKNVSVCNRNMTVRRPDALEEFNHGVVLTNRPLLAGEHFEIRLDRVIDKWAGNIEIGLTSHDPMSLEFPPTMASISEGTWMLTSNGIMYNGQVAHENYGLNEGFRRLKQGDRVGVMRSHTGGLYFTINDINLGLAAEDIPDNVYGVLDLYGQAAEASIVHNTDESPTSDLRFHLRHGTNCMVINGGRSAVRPNPNEEFTDGVVISNRPIKRNELFEIVIDKLVNRWSGSLEIGLTTMSPDTIEYPYSFSELCPPGTWMLLGSSMMQDGCMTVSTGCNFNLDTLEVGSRVGLLVDDNHELHLYIDGVDKGAVSSGIPSTAMYGVVDLYGACAGISITTGSCDTSPDSRLRHTLPAVSRATEQRLLAGPNHRFSECHGKSITLTNEQTSANRTKGFNNAVIFSADPIKSDELFEIRVDQVNRQWSGSVMIGLTTHTVSQASTTPVNVSTALELHSKGKSTWIICANKVLFNDKVIKENYFSKLDRLEVGSKVGVKRSSSGMMHLYVNGEDMGSVANGIPRNVFLVVDIYGSIEAVSIVSNHKNSKLNTPDDAVNELIRSRPTSEEIYDVDTQDDGFYFHKNCGKQIQLSNKGLTATRTTGFNQAVVVTSRALTADKRFSIRIDKLSSKWKSGVRIGVTLLSPSQLTLPSSVLSLKKQTWIVDGCSVYHCTRKVKSDYGADLSRLTVGSKLSLSVNTESRLHVYIDGVDQGVAADSITLPCYPIIDLYGQCYQVSIVGDEPIRMQRVVSEDKEKADMENSVKEKVKNPVNINCPYQQLCDRFKQCISLPDEFFKSKHNKCYCDSCQRLRDESAYKTKGHPPREYSIPMGWCRYGLRVKARAKSLKIFDVWNRAYSGIKLELVRKVLDSADLFSTAESSSRHSLRSALTTTMEGDEKKPDTFESVPVILSPSIHYASCHHFTEPIEYRDSKNHKLYKVRLAFESCIKPGSFNAGPQTLVLDCDEIQEPKLSINEIEWSTKEKASVELYGLLVKLEPV